MTNNNNGPDEVGIYLKQACSENVLTPEEEQELAAKVEKYREKFRRIALSDPPVFSLVIKKIEDVLNGSKRAETIFESSVIRDTVPGKSAKLAKRYIKKLKDPSVPMNKKVDILDRLSIKLRDLVRIWRKHGTKTPEAIKTFKKWVYYRSKMVKHNLRLVISICKKYQNTSIPMIDLIQEGNLGLMRAVDKYERRLGYKFSTYATWWIRQGITRTIAEGCTQIRIPNHLANKIHKIKKKLMNNEIEMNDEVSNLIALRDQTYLSVDELVSSSDDTHLKDLMSDTEDPTPEDRVDVKMLGDVLSDVMRAMPPRMIHLLRFRYGLGGSDPLEPDQCARIFSVTRERIYQLEYQALSALRESNRIKALNTEA